MEESAVEAWLDGILKELAESMPMVPLPQLLRSLQHTLCEGNPCLAPLIASRCSQHLKRRREDAACDPSLSDTHKLLQHLEALFPEQQQKQQQMVEVATHNPSSSTSSRQSEQDEDQGLHLISLLLQCAEAISVNKIEEANLILPQLSELVSPYGDPVHRVAAYFAEAMVRRLLTSWLGLSQMEAQAQAQLVSKQDMVAAFQVFNHLCPFVKFSHFTANQAILDAFEGQDRVHIVDFDIMQGLQWPALFHMLASRPAGPPRLKLTGLGTCMDALEATGSRLSDFAQSLGLPFHFLPVPDRAANLDARALGVSPDDTLAVHWLHHSLYDVSGSGEHTLALLQSLKPKLLTMVEQDMCHAGTFLDMFVEALRYYSAMFDSLACYPEEHPERHIVEQQLLSCEIKNILALGGLKCHTDNNTIIHQWSKELPKAGFVPVSLSCSAATQASLLLGMFPSERYTLTDDMGTLKLGWKDVDLFTASAWTYPS